MKVYDVKDFLDKLISGIKMWTGGERNEKREAEVKLFNICIALFF